jgi:hypothetical protein
VLELGHHVGRAFKSPLRLLDSGVGREGSSVATPAFAAVAVANVAKRTFNGVFEGSTQAGS